MVEAILFYAEDKTLVAPLPEIVIVEGSSIHRAYQEAGIEVDAVPATQLLAQGYCNDFLLAMATPAERELAAAKFKEPIKNHAPSPAPAPPLPDDEPAAVKDTRTQFAARPEDGERIGRGSPGSGGFPVSGQQFVRRRTVL